MSWLNNIQFTEEKVEGNIATTNLELAKKAINEVLAELAELSIKIEKCDVVFEYRQHENHKIIVKINIVGANKLSKEVVKTADKAEYIEQVSRATAMAVKKLVREENQKLTQKR